MDATVAAFPLKIDILQWQKVYHPFPWLKILNRSFFILHFLWFSSTSGFKKTPTKYTKYLEIIVTKSSVIQLQIKSLTCVLFSTYQYKTFLTFVSTKTKHTMIIKNQCIRRNTVISPNANNQLPHHLSV